MFDPDHYLELKRKYVLSLVKENVKNYKLMVVVNGKLMVLNNSAIYVKMDLDEPVFYTVTSENGFKVEVINKNAKNKVLEESCSSDFLSYDFSNWTAEYYKDSFQVKVHVDNSMLKVLYIESDMYNIISSTLPSATRVHELVPTKDQGEKLSIEEITTLTQIFRIYSLSHMQTLLTHKHWRLLNKYKKLVFMHNQAIFSPVMVFSEHIYNPLEKDYQLNSILKETRIYKLMKEKMEYVPQLGLSVTYLTHREISESLGLNKLMPFNFKIFYDILCGLLLGGQANLGNFPSPYTNIYLATDEYYNLLDRKVISEEQYLELGLEDRVKYFRTNTLSLYLQRERDFYAGKNLDLAEVEEVMSKVSLF